MGIHGYILMYSVVSRRSFDMVSTIRDKLLNAVGTGLQPQIPNPKPQTPNPKPQTPERKFRTC
jgi:hypothetical protein